MAATPAVLFLLLLFSGVNKADAPHLTIIEVEQGKTVNLSCRAEDHGSVTGVEWSRQDLTKHVLINQGGQDPVDQHPSYKDRVDLQDRQMKDGDVSLVLKNVTLNDEGIYECRLERESFDRNPICTIHLKVLPSGNKDGQKTGGGTNNGGTNNGGTNNGGTNMVGQYFLLLLLLLLLLFF